MGRIKINCSNGTVIDKPLITCFQGTNGNYIIIDNEANGPMGLPIICISKFDGTNLVKVLDQNEWASVKDNLKSIIGGTNLPYLDVPESVTAGDDFYTQLTLPVASFDLLKSVYNPPKANSVVESAPAPEAPAIAPEAAPEVPAAPEMPAMEEPTSLGDASSIPVVEMPTIPGATDTPVVDAPLMDNPLPAGDVMPEPTESAPASETPAPAEIPTPAVDTPVVDAPVVDAPAPAPVEGLDAATVDGATQAVDPAPSTENTATSTSLGYEQPSEAVTTQPDIDPNAPMTVSLEGSNEAVPNIVPEGFETVESPEAGSSPNAVDESDTTKAIGDPSAEGNPEPKDILSETGVDLNNLGPEMTNSDAIDPFQFATDFDENAAPSAPLISADTIATPSEEMLKSQIVEPSDVNAIKDEFMKSCEKLFDDLMKKFENKN